MKELKCWKKYEYIGMYYVEGGKKKSGHTFLLIPAKLFV